MLLLTLIPRIRKDGLWLCYNVIVFINKRRCLLSRRWWRLSGDVPLLRFGVGDSVSMVVAVPETCNFREFCIRRGGFVYARSRLQKKH